MIGRGTRVAAAGLVSYHWIMERMESSATSPAGPVRMLVQTRRERPLTAPVPRVRDRSRTHSLTLLPGGRV